MKTGWTADGAQMDSRPHITAAIRDLVEGRKPPSADAAQEADVFRELMEASPDGILIVDARGRIRYVNERAEELFGYTLHELAGQLVEILVPEAAREAHVASRDGFMTAQVSRRMGSGQNLAARRKDGSEIPVDISLTLINDGAGPVVMAHIRDITESRALLVSITSLEKAKTEFLNLASHELRGPITVMKGYTSMLLEGKLGTLTKTGRTAALKMEEKAGYMERLVEQMLDAARIDEDRLLLNRVQMDLREVVADAADAIRSSLDLAHPLKVALCPQPVWVAADRDRIHTILVNLLENAIKYSPQGGGIRCSASQGRSWATVRVKDQGLGIAPQDIGILFTRFGRVTTQETSHIPGTGLGLYLARELARMHDGDLLVRSRSGVGTTFTLRLPSASRSTWPVRHILDGSRR